MATQLGQVQAQIGQVGSASGGYTCVGTDVCHAQDEDTEGIFAGLQRAVNVLTALRGGPQAVLVVDGVIGPATAAAVSQLQQTSLNALTIAANAKSLAQEFAAAANISPNFQPVPSSQKPGSTPAPAPSSPAHNPSVLPQPLPAAADAPGGVHWGWWALGVGMFLGAGWLVWRAVAQPSPGVAGADDDGADDDDAGDDGELPALPPVDFEGVIDI